MQPLPRQTNFTVNPNGISYLDQMSEEKAPNIHKTSFYSNMQQSRGQITPHEAFRPIRQENLDATNAP